MAKVISFCFACDLFHSLCFIVSRLLNYNGDRDQTDRMFSLQKIMEGEYGTQGNTDTGDTGTDRQNKNKCKTSYLQRPGQVKNTEATSKEKTKARYKSKKKKKKKRSKM